MYRQRLEKQGLVEGNSSFEGEKEQGERFIGEWRTKLQHQASDLCHDGGAQKEKRKCQEEQ